MVANLNEEQVIQNPDIYIIAIGEDAITESLKLSNNLRLNNLVVINDTLRRSLKSQLKDANRLNAKYSIIIGDDEIKEQIVSLKNMHTGDQKDIPLNDILEHI